MIYHGHVILVNSSSPLQTESVRGYTDDDNASASTSIFHAPKDALLAYRPYQAKQCMVFMLFMCYAAVIFRVLDDDHVITYGILFMKW